MGCGVNGWPELTWPTGRHQLAKRGNRGHAEQAAQPDDGYYLVGVVDGLPRPGPQRVADGVVALAGYGHQGPGGHGHRGSCGLTKVALQIYVNFHGQLTRIINLR